MELAVGPVVNEWTDSFTGSQVHLLALSVEVPSSVL
jgi:hypothetical protein